MYKNLGKLVFLFILQTDSGSPVIFENQLIGIVKFIPTKSGNPVVIIRATQFKNYVDKIRFNERNIFKPFSS